MKTFEPIPVYPLRMRGRFGLTRHLYRNGFGGAFLFSLVYVLVIALVAAACLAPLVFAVVRSGAVQSIIDDLTQNLPQEIPMPGMPGMNWEFSFGEFSGTVFNAGSILLRSLGALLLLFLLWAGVVFFFQPLYESTMYCEMNARVHGQACGFGEMWRRSLHCFRTYYATYIARMVGRLGAGIVVSFGSQLLAAFSGFAVVAAALAPVFAYGVMVPLLTLVSSCIGLASQTFLQLTFPVAVAEPVKDFSALGRSLKLGWRNFWRIFLSLLLRDLYIFALMLPGGVLVTAGMLIQNNAVAVPLLVLGLLWLIFFRVYFMGFRIAFDTALYQDVAARERAPQAAPAQAAYPRTEQPAQAAAQTEAPESPQPPQAEAKE